MTISKGKHGWTTYFSCFSSLRPLTTSALVIPRRKRTERASSQSTTSDVTMEHNESATRDDQNVLRSAASTVIPPSSRFCSCISFQVASQRTVVVQSQWHSTTLRQRIPEGRDKAINSSIGFVQGNSGPLANNLIAAATCDMARE